MFKKLKTKMGKKRKEITKKVLRAQQESEQHRIARSRRKINKVANMKPGARKTIHEGLISNKTPLEVMREEYSRRKYEREKRFNK
jgi:hypothetical protein